MAAGNNFSINGVIDIDGGPANAAMATLAKSLKQFQAQTDKTTESVEVEAAALKSVASTTDSLVGTYVAAAKASATLESQSLKTAAAIRQQQLAGITQRSNARALTGAKVSAVQDVTQAKVDVAGSQAVLNASRAQSEELRQQLAISNQLDTSRLRQAQIEGQIARNQALAASETERSLARQTQSLSSLSTAAGRASQGLALAGAGLAIAGALPAIAASKFQSDFAQVTRTVSTFGDTAQASAIKLQYLKGQFVDLSNTIPVSFKDITAIGAMGGQLGIAESQLGSFTKAVAEFGATSNVSVEDAATAFGRLNALLPDVHGNFVMLGDAILKVGVTSVATESQIIAISTQISSITGAAGFGAKATIGLSGALASIGAPPELSRGTITRLFTDINKAVAAGGPVLEKFGAIAGQSGAQFASSWQSDAPTTLINFMQGLTNKGSGAAAALNDLGITSVRDVPLITRLASAIDSTGKAGGLLAEGINNANNSAGEMERQFGIVSNTVGAKAQILANNITSAFAAIGNSDLGAIGDVITNITNGIRDFSRSLDKPVMLLGTFNAGFKNADLLGWVAGITLAVGVLGLLLAVLAKGAQGFFALENIVKRITGAHAAAAAAATEQAAAEGTLVVSSTEAAQAQTRLAMAENQVIAASGGAKIALSDTTLAMAGVTAAGDAAYLKTGQFGKALGTQNAVLSKVSGLAKAAGSGIASLATAIGPGVLVAAAAAATIALVNAQFAAAKLGSTATDVAVALVQTGDASTVLSKIQNNSRGWTSAFEGPTLGAAFTNINDFNSALQNLGANNTLGDLIGQFQDVGHFFSSTTQQGYANTTATVDKLDDAFVKLGQEHGVDAEIQATTKAFKGLSDTAIDAFMVRAEGTTADFTDELASLGVAANPTTLRQLATGVLPEYVNAAAEATQTTVAFAGEFENGADGVKDFLDSVTQAIGGIADQSTAYSDALTKAQDAYKAAQGDADTTTQAYADGLAKTTANVDDFISNLKDQEAQQKDFASNLGKLLGEGVPASAIKAISDQGPQVGGAIAAMLANGSDQNRQDYIDYLDQTGTDGATAMATAIANGSSAIADAGKIAGNSGAQAIKDGLTNGTLSITPDFAGIDKQITPAFLAAIKGLPQDALNSIAVGLSTGGQTIQDVIDKYDLNLVIDPTLGPIPMTQQQIVQKELDELGIQRPVTYSPETDPILQSIAQSQLDATADPRTAPLNADATAGPLGDTAGKLDTVADARDSFFNALFGQDKASSPLNTVANLRNAIINALFGTDLASGTLNSIANAHRVSYIDVVTRTSTQNAGTGALLMTNPNGGYTGGKGASILRGFASGGSYGYKVPGIAPGNPAKDNKLAMLRSNEWVINENASKFYGDDVMSAINDRKLQVNGGGSAWVSSGASAQAANGDNTVELGPYERQLLMTIAARIGLTLDTGVVAASTNKQNTKSNRLGGG